MAFLAQWTKATCEHDKRDDHANVYMPLHPGFFNEEKLRLLDLTFEPIGVLIDNDPQIGVKFIEQGDIDNAKAVFKSLFPKASSVRMLGAFQFQASAADASAMLCKKEHILLAQSFVGRRLVRAPATTNSALKPCPLIGTLLAQEIYWSGDKHWFRGVVESYNGTSAKHKVMYDDGDSKYHDLLSGMESFRFIDTHSNC